MVAMGAHHLSITRSTRSTATTDTSHNPHPQQPTLAQLDGGHGRPRLEQHGQRQGQQEEQGGQGEVPWGEDSRGGGAGEQAVSRASNTGLASWLDGRCR